MQRAHLIECDAKAIPFLRLLINHIKKCKLTTPIWGWHMHITKTVDWDSPKGNVSWFVWMSQDHMCYNMNVGSAEVQGITDLDALADVLCPLAGKVANMLATCWPDSQMFALLANTPLSWQHKTDPDTVFLCRGLPTFTQFVF